MRRFILSLVVGLSLLVPAASASADGPCQFQLGFATIAGLIPQAVGLCTENEGHNPLNGDGLQHSTGGLLVWRKADNWTAFTDGYHSWINGPNGLQQRLNTERFSWEANPDGLTIAGDTQSVSVPAPQTPGTPNLQSIAEHFHNFGDVPLTATAHLDPLLSTSTMAEVFIDFDDANGVGSAVLAVPGTVAKSVMLATIQDAVNVLPGRNIIMVHFVGHAHNVPSFPSPFDEVWQKVNYNVSDNSWTIVDTYAIGMYFRNIPPASTLWRPELFGLSGGSTCSDGTHSSSVGSGTCSHHGGIAGGTRRTR